jgi:hypothetical protein
MYFNTALEAFEHCRAHFGILHDAWHESPQFQRQFEFEFGITDLGQLQPYVLGFEDRKIIFRVSERENFGGDDITVEKVLNISGNRAGLQHLAAILLLYSDGAQFDETMHIHLEDEAGYHLSDLPVTIRNPNFFKSLLENKFREGTSGQIIVEDEE